MRAQRAQLLGFASHAAWKLEDQMAKTPEAALQFMDALVPVATAKAASEAKDIQAVIDAQKAALRLQAWDWDFYAEQVRKAKYDLERRGNQSPTLRLNNVLENGVFYAANQLYGITFKERKDIPVYQPDVRVFEVIDVDGKPLALFYCDYFKRDNKNGGAWMSEFVGQSKLLGTLPVVYNVANLPKPAPGEPALISFDDVTTMFHEFGHALHGMFSNTRYPTLVRHLDRARLRRISVAIQRTLGALSDRVRSLRQALSNRRDRCPTPWSRRSKERRISPKGYSLDRTAGGRRTRHAMACADRAMRPCKIRMRSKSRRSRKRIWTWSRVPPRYRSSYFSHIWASGYSAGYYAYLWTQMLDDDALSMVRRSRRLEPRERRSIQAHDSIARQH